jgi:hypothetical protein
MGVRSWRCKSQDRGQWRAILEKDKVHQRLYCQKKKKKKNFFIVCVLSPINLPA